MTASSDEHHDAHGDEHVVRRRSGSPRGRHGARAAARFRRFAFQPKSNRSPSSGITPISRSSAALNTMRAITTFGTPQPDRCSRIITEKKPVTRSPRPGMRPRIGSSPNAHLRPGNAERAVEQHRPLAQRGSARSSRPVSRLHQSRPHSGLSTYHAALARARGTSTSRSTTAPRARFSCTRTHLHRTLQASHIARRTRT